LKDRGITHIRTSSAPSTLRAEQISRVGLDLNAITPVKEWLRAMGKGIKWHQKNKAAIDTLRMHAAGR